MNKRRKAFIGSIISTVGNIATSLINNKAQKDLQNQQIELQREQMAQQQVFNTANLQQQNNNNQGYVSGVQDKVTLKNGGKVNYDRIAYNKKYACGGRKRMKCGGNKK